MLAAERTQIDFIGEAIKSNEVTESPRERFLWPLRRRCRHSVLMRKGDK
jgi:hypothetical protein